MKPSLQISQGQQLVLTPQLRQAIHMLQLSIPELEAEIIQAVESNPLLDWEESDPLGMQDDGLSAASSSTDERTAEGDGDGLPSADDWSDDGWADGGLGDWDSDSGGSRPSGDDDTASAIDLATHVDTLHDHLRWQLQLTPLSPRDAAIGLALIDAIDDDGYLREPLESIQQALQPEIRADTDDILVVLHRIQRFDPVGVGARTLAECLAVQLKMLPDDVPHRATALRIAAGDLERLPRTAIDALAGELGCSAVEAQAGLDLLRSLDPRPGSAQGALPTDTYVTPDCVVWRQNGVWRVALASSHLPRLTIHRGYEQMTDSASGADATYLRGRLQEARWLIRSIEARGDTLLKVMHCLTRQQSGFLEFGPQALRPLTLREVAEQIGMHESTVSRAVARKYVRTPRGTVALRDFFASGVDTDAGGEASSTAIQAMIRELVGKENPRKPLSDAKLTQQLNDAGIHVARRTVAKYREALGIPSSHERVRMG